jgi:soluble lytic murein transglycosylase-like protein
MGGVPALPPYAHIDKEAVQCIAQASFRYGVPELLLHATISKENGRMGKCSRNSNGTYDCGLAQINTSWSQHFAKQGVTLDSLVQDTCTNLYASAYILKYNYLRKHNWVDSIIAYNIGPYRWTDARYRIGYAYATDVVSRWWGFHNWTVANAAATAAAAPKPGVASPLTFAPSDAVELQP